MTWATVYNENQDQISVPKVQIIFCLREKKQTSLLIYPDVVYLLNLSYHSYLRQKKKKKNQHLHDQQIKPKYTRGEG